MSIIQESLELFQNNFDSKLDEIFTDFSETLKNDIAKTIDAVVSKAVQKKLDKFRAEFREEINRLSERLVAVEKDQIEAKRIKTVKIIKNWSIFYSGYIRPVQLYVIKLNILNV